MEDWHLHVCTVAADVSDQEFKSVLECHNLAFQASEIHLDYDPNKSVRNVRNVCNEMFIWLLELPLVYIVVEPWKLINT